MLRRQWFTVGFCLLWLIDVTAASRPPDRFLQSGDFVSLSCNNNLASVTCVPWTQFFGEVPSLWDDRVLIPCGVCVSLEDQQEVRFNDGIDVQGKLLIQSVAKIETTAMFIQGELEITSTKAVNGVPDVIITMIGNDESQSFVPINENANMCMGGVCFVGQKAIVVAGGTLNLTGLPPLAPTWLHLHDVVGGTYTNPTSIVVSDSVLGHWTAGSQILITSHTRVWNEGQERTIVGVRPSVTPGFVEIALSASILRPTTWVEFPEFAVEVALLSRNVLFNAEDSAMGGHLEIRMTPSIPQSIDGIEIVDFGQPGILGRYPVHLHFCRDSYASIISRNSIRRSKQRGIVIHGTNGVSIAWNVLYDVTGHGYMTEDGIEIENAFTHNLGAQLASATSLISGEQDDDPAVFWISNPRNIYTDNVAAGSQDSGYWFFPEKKGSRAGEYPGNPLYETILAFSDNVAHSCIGRSGAVRTYRPGYFPIQTARLERLKIYRNNNKGIEIHRVHNFAVVDSLFADNNVGVDVDRAEDIVVQNVLIMGESESYRQLMEREDVEWVCRNQRLIGLELHSWKLHEELGGLTVSNVTFSGFTGARCGRPHSIFMDRLNLRQGQFELYASFEEVQFADGFETISFCEAEDAGVTETYIVDFDGSLSAGLVTSGKSVLLQSSPLLRAFIDADSCTAFDTGCYSYCPDICMRSYRYEISGDESTVGYLLRVCRNGDGSDCVFFPGSQRGPRERRSFVPHLPVGNLYSATFVDQSGNTIYPDILDEQAEINLCNDEEFGVSLVQSITPAPAQDSGTSPTPSPTIFSCGGRTFEMDGNFVSPSCNNGISSCQPWTSLFGNGETFENLVVIECGICVFIDPEAADLTFLGGIDIRGRLVIPDGQKIHIFTTFIVVQGEFEMASHKPVDGNPDIIVTMIGDDECRTFTPIGENSAVCSGPCLVGEKGFVVAGGKVDFHGLPMSASLTWSKLHDVSDVSGNEANTIVLEESIVAAWAPGAEILFTPHTRIWNEHQVRRIISMDVFQPGYVLLRLDAPIVMPTTVVEHPVFATEVALLSRNILLDSDDISVNGGHFEIRRTLAGPQRVVGIEIVGFGQPGVAGRYPIHVNYTPNVGDSVLAKNTIRQSKQRCIVLQGAMSFLVEQNIGFDVIGHCFMTTDGIETDNRFERNLGTFVRSSGSLIPGEQDNEPSVFWISSPTNSYIGNVAAGSEGSGFWFYPELRGLGATLFPERIPTSANLLQFSNNAVHSSSAIAIRTFRPGFRPQSLAILDQLLVYRNRDAGIVFHRCSNFLVTNSIFADNKLGIDIDRSAGISVTNTTILGRSDSYWELIQRQPGVEDVCQNRRLIGLDLHSWKIEEELGGADFQDILFHGFDNILCGQSNAIYMDPLNLKQGQFEMYYSFENVSLTDNDNTMSFCDATSSGISTFYVVDRDGGLDGRSNPTSTLIGPDPSLRTFLDADIVCTNSPVGCYSYCYDVCFRSYRFTLDAENTGAWSLRVCKASDLEVCSLFNGSQRGANDPRSFIAHLPVNQEYVAMFVDEIGSIQSNLPILEQSSEINLCEEASFSISVVESVITPQPTIQWSSLPSASPTAVATETPTVSPLPLPSHAPSLAPVNPRTSNPTNMPLQNNIRVSHFVLVNAAANEVIRQMTNDDVIQLEILPYWSIEAVTSPQEVGYVEFLLGGFRVRREGAVPYALGGDSPRGNFDAVDWLPNAYNLTAIPFDSDGLSGIPLSVSFSITASEPRIVALMLVDAGEDVDIIPIENNAVFSLRTLPDELSIKAVTEPHVVGSVLFFLDGSLERTENVSPYLLGGDREGNYNDAGLSLGTYTVTATAYSNSQGSGKEYTSLSRSFTIVA